MQRSLHQRGVRFEVPAIYEMPGVPFLRLRLYDPELDIVVWRDVSYADLSQPKAILAKQIYRAYDTLCVKLEVVRQVRMQFERWQSEASAKPS